MRQSLWAHSFEQKLSLIARTERLLSKGMSMVEFTYRCPDSQAWAILKISSPSGAFTLERMLMRGDTFTVSVPNIVDIVAVLPSIFPGESDFCNPGS